MEGDGKHYQQPRIEMRPRPKYSFDDRIYAVASSEDSVESAARLGAHMVMFSDRPWPMRLPAIQRNRELHRKFHGIEAPTMLIADFCICCAEARRGGGRWRASTWAASCTATSSTTNCWAITSTR